MDHNSLAEESLAHLARLVEQDGRFVYRYHLDGAPCRPGYNILRHCGCIWALSTIPQSSTSSPIALRAASRAAHWLVDNHVCTTPWGGVCVTERDNVKLGAAGLAVISLLALPSDGLHRFQSTIDGLCQYMIAQYDPHLEDFAHKRSTQTGLQSSFRSEYYSGQALFALISASRRFGNLNVFNKAIEILDLMMRKRVGISVQSHWMMYAVHAASLSHPSRVGTEYAIAFLANIVRDDRYRMRHECTPIACRTEALILICEMLINESESVNARLISIAMRTIEMNVSLQLRDRLSDGAFKRGSRSGEVRIDYIQHNSMSLLGYERLRSAVGGVNASLEAI